MGVTAYPPYNIDPSASSVSLANLFESITNKKVFDHHNMINLLRVTNDPVYTVTLTLTLPIIFNFHFHYFL